MDRVLGQILRQAVWNRLEMLDELADNADTGSPLSTALRTVACGVWRAAHEHLVCAETVHQARPATSLLPVGAGVTG